MLSRDTKNCKSDTYLQDAANPNCYRPISLLSIFYKLLMYNRLDSFLHKHKIFHRYQFGFRKNHATTNALTEVIDYVYKSLDEGNYVFGTSKRLLILYNMIYSL